MYEVGTKLGLRRTFLLCHKVIAYFYATDKQIFVVWGICCGFMVFVGWLRVRWCFKVMVILIRYKSKIPTK